MVYRREHSPPKRKAKAKSSSPKKTAKPLKTSQTTRTPIYARRCEGEICCQATTADGSQCSRPAVVKIDLTRGIKVIGVAPVDCCFYCTQHAKILATNKIANLFYNYGPQIAKTIGGKDLSYDEYYALFPEEISVSLAA